MKRNVLVLKPHPWRICPLGAHFVKEHHRRTKKGTIIVKSHCRKSPIHKEILNTDEILEMFKRNKDQITDLPNPSHLGYGNENRYDTLIGLWTQFWNEIYQIKPPLDPNWVKALIATESSFDANQVNKANKKNLAFGLMQITEKTYKIATDSKGELKDVSFRVNRKDLFVPDANVAVGTRWIFRKREVLRSRIGREPSWEEVMWEYKGIYGQSSPRSDEIKKKLRDKYEKICSGN